MQTVSHAHLRTLQAQQAVRWFGLVHITIREKHERAMDGIFAQAWLRETVVLGISGCDMYLVNIKGRKYANG